MNRVSKSPIEQESANFIKLFAQVSKQIHDDAVRKGFWQEEVERNDGEIIALIHSELSEALEALRRGNPPDEKIPEFDGYTAELADCIIRIMDVAAARDLPLAEAIVAKIQYNKTRPFKHGKSF